MQTEGFTDKDNTNFYNILINITLIFITYIFKGKNNSNDLIVSGDHVKKYNF